MYIDDEKFDELLTAALYRASEIDSADDPTDEELEKLIKPSPRAQRRMNALIRNPKAYIRRHQRPVYLKVLRSAAAVFVSVMILFGATVAVSTSVRAAVSNFVRSWFEDSTEYWTPESDLDHKLSLGYMPDGFELFAQQDLNTDSILKYKNSENVEINIIVSRGSHLIDNEHYTIVETVINDFAADIYESTESVYPNRIMLHENTAGVIISIISDVELDELIKIAEGIE